MLIEIHAIQNHSPANLNRDDLGAPKTCYFGGVMRSRISSQCIKRSIRMSEQFKLLCGGVRTRQLAKLIADQVTGKPALKKRVAKILEKCGIAPKDENKSDMLVYTTKGAVAAMASLLQDGMKSIDRVEEIQRDLTAQRDGMREAGPLLANEVAKLCDDLLKKLAAIGADSVGLKESFERAEKEIGEHLLRARGDGNHETGDPNESAKRAAVLLQGVDGALDDAVTHGFVDSFGRCISNCVAVPDMALAGRMLETGVLTDTTVDASLQVAHAISTHEARPEVDYYVAADDIPGSDAGAGYVDEAMFASACFYKYFSVHWETLVANLKDNKELAAHTVGAFLRGAALANPTGKQNSFAAHNPPDGIVVEVKKEGGTPISYANAFAAPVPSKGPRDIISQSIAQLGQYIHDLDTGYRKTGKRFWFSPNLRHNLTYIENDKEQPTDTDAAERSLDALVVKTIKEIGFDWAKVQTEIINTEV